jgi:SAM-dependent methyltransferase
MMDRFVQKLRQQGVLSKSLEVLRKLGLLTVTFRLYEKLSALSSGENRDRPTRQPKADGPVPPPELIVLVAGTASVEWFLTFGRAMFQAIVDLLRDDAAPVEDMHAILEFGCGCGRVLRYWQSVRGPTIYGTDYNPRLVDWCRQNLPFAKASRNDAVPPLLYADQMFDCIYAISVFTHLSAELQTAWLRELGRVLKPGGHLLVTTQGNSFRQRMAPSELADFDAGRLVVRYEETSGTNLCSAYHPEAYVRQHLAVGYSVRKFVPAGTRQELFQDIYVMRKEGSGIYGAAQQTPGSEAVQ